MISTDRTYSAYVLAHFPDFPSPHIHTFYSSYSSVCSCLSFVPRSRLFVSENFVLDLVYSWCGPRLGTLPIHTLSLSLSASLGVCTRRLSARRCVEIYIHTMCVVALGVAY